MLANWVFALSRPQHHGSTPKGSSNFFTQSDLRYPLLNWASQKFDGKLRLKNAEWLEHSIWSALHILWLELAQQSQWRAYRKPISLFPMVRSTSTTSSYLKLEVPNAPIVSNLNANISATGHPIHFMLCSRVGFSGSADRMTLFPVRLNTGWQPAAILENYSGIARFPCDSMAFLLFLLSLLLSVYYFDTNACMRLLTRAERRRVIKVDVTELSTKLSYGLR